MRLAVDVMGGDHAPDAILKGCVDGLAALGADDRLLLVGPPDTIEEVLRERGVADARLEIVPALETIGMDESPVEAVRLKKDSSIVKMCALAGRRAEHPVDAVISAGNTGACVSAATMQMRRLRGVHRPGIAVTVPSFHGPIVLCDAGANPEPRAVHLMQYAIMAEVYAAKSLGIASPRVALLNIGAEEAKGTKMVKQVRDLLRAVPGLNFQGYIEARDLFDGVADVIVTDGFVGNTALKLAEGLARSLVTAVFQQIMEHDPTLALQLEPAAKAIFTRNDYHEYGGAPLLGVNGVCVICHGSSEPKTIASAIRNTREYVARHVNDEIVHRLAEVTPIIEPHLAALGEAEPAAADSAA
jgi:glycerol-3-phosphate acyltransferase PlsX